MSFDETIDWRGKGTSKWDMMETLFGVSPDDGLAMWVADGDYRAPDFILNAMQQRLNGAHFGYFADGSAHLEAASWWMKSQHGWDANPDHMFTTGGIGNAIALTMQGLTNDGDHVAIFSPVYHEFRNKIERGNRVVTELPLVIEGGIYRMDFDRYDDLMTGKETALIISSPHNPAGRVWTVEEQKQIAEFCERHDLLLLCDEIHHDLIHPGFKHVPMTLAAPDVLPRLIMMTAASKTFSIAGLRTGTITIPDDALRARFFEFYKRFDIAPNLLGMVATRAAYSPEGAAYVAEKNAYIAENARILNAGVNEIPGVTGMPMQSTYLAWVEFGGTGMTRDEIAERVYKGAKIAATPGHTLGLGGETCMRINLATSRERVEQAVQRLQDAFSDLQ